MPQGYQRDGLNLGRWVEYNRVKMRKGQLVVTKRALLEDIGFSASYVGECHVIDSFTFTPLLLLFR